jgi:hypothetical protein
MKIHLRLTFALLALLFVPPLLVLPGCGTPPPARVAAVQTLKSVGQAAEASVALSAKLYAAGSLTAARARTVLDVYNGQFQPAFRLAVAAAKSDLAPASPDLINLAQQLADLVSTYNPPPK